MYVLTAFHRCSDVMKPFLMKFLQDASSGPGQQYQGEPTSQPVTDRTIRHLTASSLTGIAKACEQNLRRTFQYGGRVQYPNSMELKAMLVSF